MTGKMQSAAIAAVLIVGMGFTAFGVTELEKKITAEHPLIESDSWGGGHRMIFEFEGRKAWIVEPVEGTAIAKGMPWVWTMQWMGAYLNRTGAPDLTRRGFHHVHLEAFELRANEEGLKAFASFQKYLVEKLGFAPKANLIGMSWGGFFSVRYANAYPQNVRKMYLDAPLLNFAGDYGKGGGPEEGATELGPWAASRPALNNWMDDPRMPVNMAAAIAKAGIPVCLLYGGQDSTVPPFCNAELFAARYKTAGGPQIIVEGRPLYGHHPHGFEHEDLWKIIDFFEK